MKCPWEWFEHISGTNDQCEGLFVSKPPENGRDWLFQDRLVKIITQIHRWSFHSHISLSRWPQTTNLHHGLPNSCWIKNMKFYTRTVIIVSAIQKNTHDPPNWINLHSSGCLGDDCINNKSPYLGNNGTSWAWGSEGGQDCSTIMMWSPKTNSTDTKIYHSTELCYLMCNMKAIPQQ